MGRRLDPFSREAGDGIVGPGRVQLTAAVVPPSVVVLGILGQDAAQVSLADDQHPVGDLRSGSKHEPFGISVRARTPGRDLHGFDACAGQGRVERGGELPGAVADQKPEV